jgi:integrase
LKAELETYLDKKFNPKRGMKKAVAGNFIEDHKKMIAAMRSGELLKKKSKKRYSPKSIDQFERMRKRWEECAADNESGFVLSYNMTIDVFNKLVVWLVKNQYLQNSIYNVVNNLKIFLTWSHNEGRHNNTVYKHPDFNVPQEDADAIAPAYKEIENLYKCKFTKKADDKHKDFFVYGCFLALRVEDLRRINEYYLVGDVFEVLTKKTGQKVTIPCHWIAREIYEKYNGKVPIVWRQNLAKRLPDLCKEAGITGKKLITYTAGGVKVEGYYERYQLIQPHTMRRFYATWMYYELKYPPKAIMPITGHKSEAQFLKYVKIEDELNAKEIASSPAFQKPPESSSGPSVVE